MTAFGKDRSVLRDMPSFRQLSGQFSANRGGRTPKGGPHYFIDQYKPPTGDSDLITIIPGPYEHMEVDSSGEKPVAVPVILPYVEFVEHFDGKTQKSVICSAGPFRQFRDHRDRCNGCDIFWATLEPGPDGKKRSTRMNRQSKCAFGIIDFSVYHRQPQFDAASGKPKVNPRTQKQYFNWVKCEGRGCLGCKEKLETKFGHNPHWPMSWNYKETLRVLASEVGKSCGACHSIETIRSVAWVCRECGQLAIDMDTTTLSREDLEKMTERYYTCAKPKGCGKTSFLKELVECTACANGWRLPVYDVAFKAQKIMTGVNNQSNLNVSGWSPLPKEGPAALLRDLCPKNMKVPTPQEIEVLCTPKELLKIFSPTPYKLQVERFGPAPLTAPSEPSPEEPAQSREYGEQYQ